MVTSDSSGKIGHTCAYSMKAKLFCAESYKGNAPDRCMNTLSGWLDIPVAELEMAQSAYFDFLKFEKMVSS